MAHLGILVDKDRSVHVVGMATKPNRRYDMVYARMPLTGTWPSELTTILVDEYTTDAKPRFVPDGNGGIHLVWTRDFGYHHYQLFYCHKAVDSNECTEHQSLTTHLEIPHNASIASDSKGGFHIVWSAEGGFRYQHRSSNGEWSNLEVIAAMVARLPHIAQDSKGDLHAVWRSYLPSGERSAFYSHRSTGGRWSEPVEIAQAPTWTTRLAVGVDGTVHMLYGYIKSIWYRGKAPDGAWSTPIKVIESDNAIFISAVAIEVDEQGVAHLAYIMKDSAEAEPVFYYMVKRPGQPWQFGTSIPITTDVRSFSLAVDPSGIIYSLWKQDYVGSYNAVTGLQTAVAIEDGESGLSQTVTLPSTIHRPTFSFLVRSEGIASARHPLTIKVDDGQSTTTVGTVDIEGTQWQHIWIDMSQWAGKTVTVGITSMQLAGTAQSRVFIDSITIGSWLTPLIHWTTPSTVATDAPTRITIYGQNFRPTPGFWVGDTELTNVEWLSEYVVRATVPPGLVFGTHDINVTNPGGQEGSGRGMLRAGRWLYIPSFAKELR